MKQSTTPGRALRAAPMPWTLLLILLSLLAQGCQDDTRPVPGAAPGAPLPGLTDAERGRFLLGRALFERIATPEEGLGPLFNAERCSSCHDDPAPGGSGARVPVRKVSRYHDGVCSTLAEAGGDNLQQRLTPALEDRGVAAERVPAAATASILVTAPALFGLGLLEAVPQADLVQWADPDDEDGDGISGRLPRRADGAVTRFGRKGDATTVQDFVEQALLQELGFTSPRFPRELGHEGMTLPPEADPFPDPEMTPEAVTLLTDFVRYLAPPAPAPSGDTEEGEALFRDIGCASCHVPVLRTGDAPEEALSNVSFSPFTDLLLHDMGYGPGDVCTPQAAPGEYRTAPLWGLRYRRTFMHDGRATSVLEAVEAHGGEASHSRDAFLGLEPDERERILRFLSGL